MKVRNSLKSLRGRHRDNRLVRRKGRAAQDTLADASSYATITSRAQSALTAVELSDRANDLALTLSHGEQRQLEIAMCLATQPDVLLLDEPLAGMGVAAIHDFVSGEIRRPGGASPRSRFRAGFYRVSAAPRGACTSASRRFRSRSRRSRR